MDGIRTLREIPNKLIQISLGMGDGASLKLATKLPPNEVMVKLV
jgi:hypothetical protein